VVSGKKVLVVCPQGSETMAEVARIASFRGGPALDPFEMASLRELYEMVEELFEDIKAGARIFFHYAWPAFATAPVATGSGYARQWPASSAVPLTPYAE
jgi:hypothetical protein